MRKMDRNGRSRHVFLDIGAHIGETLATVTEDRWGYDAIYSFEPAPPCWPALDAYADERVTVCRFGLSDRTQRIALHNPGAIGASTSADKDGGGVAEVCDFVDAAAWFDEHIRDADIVYAKVNIEGAEPEVIAALDDAGQLVKVDHLLIHFDVRKVPSRAHLEPEVRARLDRSGVEYVAAERLFYGDVYRGTRNWLEWCALPPSRRRAYEAARRAEGKARVALYPLKQKLLINLTMSR